MSEADYIHTSDNKYRVGDTITRTGDDLELIDTVQGRDNQADTLIYQYVYEVAYSPRGAHPATNLLLVEDGVIEGIITHPYDTADDRDGAGSVSLGGIIQSAITGSDINDEEWYTEQTTTNAVNMWLNSTGLSRATERQPDEPHLNEEETYRTVNIELAESVWTYDIDELDEEVADKPYDVRLTLSFQRLVDDSEDVMLCELYDDI